MKMAKHWKSKYPDDVMFRDKHTDYNHNYLFILLISYVKSLWLLILLIRMIIYPINQSKSIA